MIVVPFLYTDTTNRPEKRVAQSNLPTEMASKFQMEVGNCKLQMEMESKLQMETASKLQRERGDCKLHMEMGKHRLEKVKGRGTGRSTGTS